jgi:hypothetical protein
MLNIRQVDSFHAIYGQCGVRTTLYTYNMLILVSDGCAQYHDVDADVLIFPKNFVGVRLTFNSS